MSILKSAVAGVMVLMALTSVTSAQTTIKPEKYPVYNGELGVKYSAKKTVFKVWAPKASAVKLRLYDAGEGGSPIQEIDLVKKSGGSWQTTIKQNIKNKYYTFQMMQDGKWSLEAPDIYAKAVGVNGHRGI